MSRDELTRFNEDVANDASLLEKISSLGEPAEIVAFANDNGYHFTEEEFCQTAPITSVTSEELEQVSDCGYSMFKSSDQIFQDTE